MPNAFVSLERTICLLQDSISLLLEAKFGGEAHRKRLHCVYDAVRSAVPTSGSHTVLL